MSNHSRAQIVATIGPASADPAVLRQMCEHQLDVARLNFSWGTLDEHHQYIHDIRSIASELGRRIPIIQDVPGPRIQDGAHHSFDADQSGLTAEDEEFIRFGVDQGVEYVAVSFVKDAEDIERARAIAGSTKLIAKIERQEALDNINTIVEAADAVMIARGDLGNNTPLEKLPFVQVDITDRANTLGKPVITATEMLLSMTERERPSRAEVTDVAYAILHGSDAVMLSEETANGRYPVEAVAAMEQIVLEAERVRGHELHVHAL